MQSRIVLSIYTKCIHIRLKPIDTDDVVRPVLADKSIPVWVSWIIISLHCHSQCKLHYTSTTDDAAVDWIPKMVQFWYSIFNTINVIHFYLFLWHTNAFHRMKRISIEQNLFHRHILSSHSRMFFSSSFSYSPNGACFGTNQPTTKKTRSP